MNIFKALLKDCPEKEIGSITVEETKTFPLYSYYKSDDDYWIKGKLICKGAYTSYIIKNDCWWDDEDHLFYFTGIDTAALINHFENIKEEGITEYYYDPNNFDDALIGYIDLNTLTKI